MSVCWLSSFSSSSSSSSCFTSLTVVEVGGRGRGRGRRLTTSNSNWWWRREGGTLLLNCSSDSNSNSNSSRGFGRPPQSNTNNNTTKKKKNNNNKLDNSNSNSNSVLAPGLLTSPGGGRNSLRTPITSNTTSNDLQFDQRLQAIKRSALEQKKLVQNTQYGAIDYDHPPDAPISNNNTDSPKPVGLGAKIGIGVAVVIFGFVFALGDFLPTSSDAPSEKATVVDSKLSAEEMKTLRARLQQFEASLTVTPKDPIAVEGAAVTLAELGDYSRASSLLDDLTKMKPNDPDAFRLLGEVRYQLKDYEGSAAAYKRSAMVSKTINFEVLRGLTNTLLAAKRPDEAVQVLLASRERLNAKTLADGQAESKEIDPIQVELLLGKAYSDWGHVSDAVSVYDQLISSQPNDFRGYLAKGIILKENGRSGDAERMFIQARFFAPEKAKALVDRYSRK